MKKLKPGVVISACLVMRSSLLAALLILAPVSVSAKDFGPVAVDVPKDVEKFFSNLATDYANQDVDNIMASVSEGFLFQGLNKNGFRKNLQESYFFRKIHEVDFVICRFERKGDIANFVGVMKTNFGVMSSSMHLIPMREGSQLIRVKGKWKLLGDQQPRATGMFREAHLIETIFEPQDLAMYRTLLPSVLNMPAVPKVKMSVVKQEDVVYPLGPYKLGFIYLLGEYEGIQRWHVLTMPEDTWVPVKHGNGWGYPKYVVDKIEFEQTSKGFYGAVEDRGEKLFSLNFSEDSSQASLFERLTSNSPLIFLRYMLADEEIPVITFSPYSLDVPTENKAVIETKQLLLGVPSELSDKFGQVNIGVGSDFPWKPLLPENKIVPGRVGYFIGEMNLNRTMLRAPLGEKIGRTSIIDMVDE